jgi:hypothetical protein
MCHAILRGSVRKAPMLVTNWSRNLPFLPDRSQHVGGRHESDPQVAARLLNREEIFDQRHRRSANVCMPGLEEQDPAYDWTDLRRGADEVGCLVGATRALVLGDLRERAQRARHRRQTASTSVA